MSRIKLDLSQFRHVKSDKNATTLQHKAGHILTLANNALGPEAQAQLKALSSISKDAQTPLQQDEAKHKFSKGGEATKTDEEPDTFLGIPLYGKGKSSKSNDKPPAPNDPKKSKEMSDVFRAEGGEISAPQQKPKEKPVSMPDPNAPQTKAAVNWEKGSGGWWAEGGGVKPQINDQDPKSTGWHPGTSVYEAAIKDDDDRGPSVAESGGDVQDDRGPSVQSTRKNMAGGGGIQASRQKYAEGTKRPLRSQEEYTQAIHAPDNYGGGTNVREVPARSTAAEDDSIATEDQAAELAGLREARKVDLNATIPSQAPDIAQETPQDIGGVKQVVPKMEGSTYSPSDKDPDFLQHMAYLSGKYGSEAVQNYAQRHIGPIVAGAKLANKLGEGLIAGASGEPETPTTEQVAITPNPPEQPKPPVIQPPAPLPQPSPDQIEQSQQASSSPTLQSDIAMTNNPMGMAQQGYANQIQAENAKALATQGLATGESQALATDAAAKQKMLAHFQNMYSALDNERLAHIQDIQNGYIDPNAYWKDHSKIASGIGMILAGFNPSGSPNAAIDFLKYQMDRNIDAQRANLNAKNNLLSANLQQFRNIEQATNMTRIMQNDVVTNQLQQAAANAKTPMAQAAAQAAIGQIQMQSSQLFRQLAMTQAVMDLNKQGGPQSEAEFKAQTTMMRMMGMEPQAKDIEAKHIPGVPGSASREVPEELKQRIQAMNVLDNKGKDVLNYVEQHKGTWNPQTRAVGAQKIEEMKNFYNDSIKGGALTQGRLGWYDEQFAKHPTDVFSQLMGSTAKLKEMVDSNANRRNMELKSLGFPAQVQQQQAPAQTPQAALNWAKSHPNDARAKEILKRLGQ